MELIFNELSAVVPSGDKYVAIEKMDQFVKTFAKAKGKGFRHIRSHYFLNEIGIADNYSLYDWSNDNEISKNQRDLIFGIFIHPFIKEDDEIIEERYINANYYFESIEHDIIKTQCVGLASAYLYDTLSISLPSLAVWDQTKLPIIIEKESQTSESHVFNVSSETSFSNSEVSDFIDNISKLELVETSLAPVDKNIHLAKHHGVQELQCLCDSLMNSPYVIEMRSTDWGGSKFIRKTCPGGVIEIVLFKTDHQYALRVQTTGRNHRETKEIAKILDSKYS